MTPRQRKAVNDQRNNLIMKARNAGVPNVMLGIMKTSQLRRIVEAVNKDNKSKTKVVADGGGLRKDDGKNMLDLIPLEWIWGLGEVLTQGAEKYAIRNWERGMKWSKMIGCGLRHVVKFACGERYDPESGCHHLLHAAWNFLALMSYDLRGVGENDLPTFEGLFGIKLIAATMDPEHPRTKRLRKLAEDRIEAARQPKEQGHDEKK